MSGGRCSAHRHGDLEVRREDLRRFRGAAGSRRAASDGLIDRPAVPETQGLVGGGGEQVLVVRRDRGGEHASGVPLEVVEEAELRVVLARVRPQSDAARERRVRGRHLLVGLVEVDRRDLKAGG